MSLRNDFTLRPKRRKDLSLALRMYGENESPEVQVEHMWEVYSPSTAMVLLEPKPDFSGFSHGDRMYPTMMEPEIKERWEQKQKEWEIAKERYGWRKRLAHFRFIHENRNHKLARDLSQTEYGKALIEEFSSKQKLQSQPVLNKEWHDEFNQAGPDSGSEAEPRITPFIVSGSEKPFSVLATKRDEDGRIVEKICSLEPKDHHLRYEYDAGGRLHKVWKDERLIEEYLYGKYGERYFGTTQQAGQRRFIYGPGLRLEQAGNLKYSYDDHGRMVMKQNGSNVTKYQYHQSGLLQQVNLPDGRRISYVIDPHGRRMAKQVNSRTVESYSWDNSGRLAVVVDGEGNNRKEFVYNDECNPVSMYYNGQIYSLASDQVGTIYMVADAGGNEIKRIIRDSFGNLTVDTNERIKLPLGFAAGLHDTDTGLVHFGQREYEPSIGLFIQPDQLVTNDRVVDAYSYCHNDPVNIGEWTALSGNFG
ncbi:RHS repeat-associated core domain-containing protein [Maridesulfovibrio sp.]|uniref:RHS repeat domain-containing protein n=1 Tax=Maridesulfovibrio sp. TaxID=2795000 RepID=UPI0029F48832|nr:RHS repeat-associated core domain-containing protein [Maridesulfovibrio sp.]